MRQVLILLLLTTLNVTAQELSVTGLTCEGRRNPMGVDILQPKFSWQINSSSRACFQTAFRVLVSDRLKDLQAGKGTIWDSKKSLTPQSIRVSFNGADLKPATTYYWKVQVWDNKGKVSPFSVVQHFTTGLYKAEDWSGAKWIGYEDLPDSMRIRPGIHGNGNNLKSKGMQRAVAPLLRKEFLVTRPVASATLFISGLGQYESEINGKKIGEDFLSPGWTDYDKTCLYNTYDVTAEIRKGKNAMGVIVGNGFHYINRERYRKLVTAFGMPKMISRLVIRFTDGNAQTIVSGSDWKVAPSPVIYNSIFGGEDYDARLEQRGWSSAGFDDRKWKNALLVQEPKGKLASDQNDPITVNEKIYVKTIANPRQGTYLYDFGQNASGIIELKVQGKAGDTVKIIPAELINDQHLTNQRNSGSPFYFFYILKGGEIETWRPRFTYYGFRYVQIEGAGPDTAHANGAKIKNLVFLHTGNSAAKIGVFKTSNKLFNRAFTLIDWAIKSNLQSVATDCPHREKLGWLEQDYLMGGSIHYNYDIYPLYRKLVYDMIDAQSDSGLIPSIVPEYVYFGGAFTDSPEWGTAGVALPWLLYSWYGDKDIVKDAYPMVKGYVNYLKNESANNILSYGLGDWYDLGPKFPGIAQLTPIALTATASYYYDADLLSKMAGLLGNTQDSIEYARLASDISRAFNEKFFNASTNIYATGSQTSMSMPLVVGLVKDENKKAVLKNLMDSIYASGKSLTAGDIGFHYLVKALADNGGSQLLYDMNNRDDVPGYGFQLKKGATALTESWAALREVSNNHLMLGHLMEWFYSGLGGINAADDAVAFNKVVIRPNAVGDVAWTTCIFTSPYGRIMSNWKRSDRFEIDVEIPANSTASIYLPTSFGDTILEGNLPAKSASGVFDMRKDGPFTVVEVGSGKYHFTVSK